MTPLIILCVLGALACLAYLTVFMERTKERFEELKQWLQQEVNDAREFRNEFYPWKHRESDEVAELRAKLSLLESHLNLTYIPEGTREARYEEKELLKDEAIVKIITVPTFGPHPRRFITEDKSIKKPSKKITKTKKK